MEVLGNGFYLDLAHPFTGCTTLGRSLLSERCFFIWRFTKARCAEFSGLVYLSSPQLPFFILLMKHLLSLLLIEPEGPQSGSLTVKSETSSRTHSGI